MRDKTKSFLTAFRSKFTQLAGKLKRVAWRSRVRKFSTIATTVSLITVMVLALSQPALAAVTVSTSTNSAATQYSQQRKTWFDGTRYWVGFYDGTQIVFYYSTNGSSWTINNSATIALATPDFSIEADSTNAFIAEINPSTGVTEARSATSYPGTGFAWSTATTAITKGSGGNNNRAVIIRDTNNKIMVASQVNQTFLSFLAGTQILMADGQEKQIQDIQKGDTVKGFDPDTLAITSQEVTRAFSYQTSSYIEVRVGSRVVSATANHFFLSANHQYLPLSDLDVGDEVFVMDDGIVQSESISEKREIRSEVAVYNFSTSGFHNYIANRFLVHNPCVQCLYWYSNTSTNANDVTVWGTIASINAGIGVTNRFGALAPLASGNDYSVYIRNTAIEGKKNASGTWDTNPTAIATGATGDANNMSMVSNTTANEAYMSYIDSGGKTQFRKYIDSENTGWTVPFDHATESNVTTFTEDTTNKIIYAATAAGGIIYRCDTSTLCDASGDWTQVYDTGDNWMDSSTFDPTNGVLYFTAYVSAGAAHIYRCDITTTGSCNDSSDWTSYVITNAFASIYMDVANGVLYAGNWTNGNMSRCLVSSACDQNTDWATYDISTEATIYAITEDTTNHILYAGTGEGGFIYRCDITATNCDAAIDWASAYDTAYTEITNMTFDSDNGILYFAAYGSASDGPVLRCDITTTGSCNDSTDYTVSYNPASTDFFSIKADLVNDVIYAGTLAGGIIYSCPTASLCDAAGDWSVAFDSATERGIDDIFSDPSTGILYAGTFDGAQIERYANGWKPPVALDTNSGNAYTSISINTANNDLYAFWIRANTLYYKKGVSPYASANWDGAATTVYNTGTNTWATTAASVSSSTSSLPIIWTNGAGSPFNVDYAAISFNSPPAAPSLVPPAQPLTGATGIPYTGYVFKARAADPDGDYLRYEFTVYDSANCTSTVMEDAVQTGGAQGTWTNQDQQTSTAYTGNATEASSTMAFHGYAGTNLTANHTYSWKARAIDPGGSNGYGSYSSCQSFLTSQAPATPTLINPVSTQISAQPQFELRTTDADSDYLKYFIQLYDATACGGLQVGSDIDQTASQTGWQNQDQQSGTAYTGSAAIANSSVARYQYSGTPLIISHVYSWRAKAIDPGGSNTFSSLTSCQDLTTAPQQVNIHGGVNIHGTTNIH